MKTFSFRLHALVTVRSLAEQRALKAFAEAVRRRCREETELKQLCEAVELLNRQLKACRKKEFLVGNQETFAKVATNLNVDRDRLGARVDQARCSEREALSAFLHARSQNQVLDRLREKARADHMLEEMKSEERNLEEICLTNRVRWEEVREK